MFAETPRSLLYKLVAIASCTAASSSLLPVFVVAAVRGSPGASEVLALVVCAMWVAWWASLDTMARVGKTRLIHRLSPGPDQYPSSVTRPQVVLAHPHGVLMLAANFFLPSGLTVCGDHTILCFPGFLGALLPPRIRRYFLAESPYVKAVARRAGAVELVCLSHPSIERLMSRKDRDLGVYAGGFEELVDHSTARLCTSRWGYWVRQALRRGYDITFYYVLGSETLFSPSPAWLSGLARWLIDKGIKIPLLVPGWSDRASHPMAPLFYRHTLPYIPEPDAACVNRHTAEFRAAVQARLDTVFREMRPELRALQWRRPTLGE